VIPISDADAVRRGRPFVNIALIAINAVVFIYELFLSDFETFRFTYQFGIIPRELTSGAPLDLLPVRTPVGILGVDVASPIPAWGTVFTSMFMHGGWMHILGNMLYLWVFGDNVEARLGHIKYLLFYLGAGVAAAWAQVATDLDSTVPLIGASGAISGVLGAYLLLYPYNRVTTLVFFFIITVIQVPALLVLGVWFILQLFNGVGSLGPAASGVGVAYMAHVGGFAAGALFIAGYKLLLREPLWPRPPYYWRPWRF